jgi:hypothetical protein
MRDVFLSFHPDADELLRRISCHITDASLIDIAGADYGNDVEKHFFQLRLIRDQGLLNTPMRWHPREVLELIRWSEPEDPNWLPGVQGERGHWMRAFACSCLLRAAGEPENEELQQGWNQTLIQLIDSLCFLKNEILYQPAAAFLAWLIPRASSDDGENEVGFLLLGLLWFALHLQTADKLVIALSESISDEVKRVEEIWEPSADRWLLATTCFELRHKKWETLGRTLAEMSLPNRSSAAIEWVKLIGSELSGMKD